MSQDLNKENTMLKEYINALEKENNSRNSERQILMQ